MNSEHPPGIGRLFSNEASRLDRASSASWEGFFVLPKKSPTRSFDAEESISFPGAESLWRSCPLAYWTLSKKDTRIRCLLRHHPPDLCPAENGAEDADHQHCRCPLVDPVSHCEWIARQGARCAVSGDRGEDRGKENLRSPLQGWLEGRRAERKTGALPPGSTIRTASRTRGWCWNQCFTASSSSLPPGCPG